jgi:RNA polymerase sigma factor (sigma-70 family)
MSEGQDLAALLVQHLPYIDRVCAKLCRRNPAGVDEAEEFAGWAKARLIENEYAVLRKFRGESALTTYLNIVLTRLHRDFAVERRGRWRRSAAAGRAGSLAVRLETLVRRDRHTLDQAGQLLRSRGETTLSDAELARLLAGLPDAHRGRPLEVGDEPLAVAPSSDRADAGVLAGEAAAEREAARRALQQALAPLGEEDRVILTMRFWQGDSVADIARALHLEQKPLYRRLDRLLARLREDLERQGLSRQAVAEMLAHREEDS